MDKLKRLDVKDIVIGVLVVLLIIVSVVALSGQDSEIADTAESEPKTEQSSNRPPTDNKQESIAKNEVVEDTTNNKDEVSLLPSTENHEEMAEFMSEYFDGLYMVDYNESNNAFEFMAGNDDLATEMMHLMTGVIDDGDWNYLAVSLAELSSSISENLNDKSVALSILNPFDKERTLLVVRDGEIVYNFTDER